MILDVTGFGWSGSGAYHDLLREYDNIEFPYKSDWEFQFLWAVDGLYDLEQKLCTKHCRVYDSDVAISRFLNLAKKYSTESALYYDKVFQNPSFYDLCESYVNQFIGLEMKARCLTDIVLPNRKEPYVRLYNKTIGKLLCNRITRKILGSDCVEKLKLYNPHLMRVAYEPEYFEEKTQDFVAKLLSYVRKDTSKTMIMDQMFPPDCPELFQKYVVEDHKYIVVRRDPRDTFIAMNKTSNFPYPVPRNVSDFIWFYRNIVLNTKLEDNNTRMSVSFEDIIYNYDETISKIEAFANIGSHVAPRTYFVPEVSINNTQLVTLYPEFEKDVRLIEAALPDALYPFEKYHFKRTSNSIF